MDWQAIRQAICEGRRFEETQKGRSVVADTMMPSGHVIRIYMRADHDKLVLHDDGAAFDELAAQGREATSLSGVRHLLSEIDLRLDETGTIFMDRLDPANVAAGIAILADASLRAAQFMLARSRPRRGMALDKALQDRLRVAFPDGRPNFRFNGRSRQHKFDFGMARDGQTILVDAVTPDASSVNAAVVKTLDALRSTDEKARPILVYDAKDGWRSDMLGLLTMGGGEYMSIDAVNEGRLLAA